MVPSSSHVNFGQRPPEARGKRTKILSVGGESSNQNFYKSAGAQLAGVIQNSSTDNSSRPANNSGCGELKTQKSQDGDLSDGFNLN